MKAVDFRHPTHLSEHLPDKDDRLSYRRRKSQLLQHVVSSWSNEKIAGTHTANFAAAKSILMVGLAPNIESWSITISIIIIGMISKQQTVYAVMTKNQSLVPNVN